MVELELDPDCKTGCRGLLNELGSTRILSMEFKFRDGSRLYDCNSILACRAISLTAALMFWLSSAILLEHNTIVYPSSRLPWHITSGDRAMNHVIYFKLQIDVAAEGWKSTSKLITPLALHKNKTMHAAGKVGKVTCTTFIDTGADVTCVTVSAHFRIIKEPFMHPATSNKSSG